MYGYDISNEVSPKVVSTSVQQNWMRSHDLTKLRLIKNFPAKTSHKTENQNFSSKFQFWYDNFMFRCLCSKPANTQWILCSKWFFSTFFSFNWVQRTLKCQRITFETVSTSNLRFLCWSQKNEKNKKMRKNQLLEWPFFPWFPLWVKKNPICLAFLQNLVVRKFQSTKSSPILLIWP